MLNRILLSGLLLGFLANPQMKADYAPAGPDRPMRSTDPEDGRHRGFRRRIPKGRLHGSGQDIDSRPMNRGRENNGSDPHNSGASNGPPFVGQAGSSTVESWFSFFSSPTYASGSHGTKGHSDTGGHDRERYSMPEPGGFIEAGIMLAGLAWFALRRRSEANSPHDTLKSRCAPFRS